MKKDKVIIYTDGAARGNPGPAGWGSIVMFEEKIFEMGGRSDHATNNIMELTAPIEGLKFLLKNKITLPVEIFSDSKYVINGISEWIFNWLKNDWRTASKKQVLNKELWVELYDLTKNFDIKWTYVKGHSDNEWNNRADEIATNFADDIKIELKNGH